MKIVVGNSGKQPFVNAFWAFHEKHRLAFRVAGHLLMCVVALYLSYETVITYIDDNQYVVFIATLGILIQTLAVYYLLVLYVFPRYFYSFKALPFILCLALIFWLVFLSNYYLFDYLSDYNTIQPVNTPYGSIPYTIALSKKLETVGLFGCFTNASMASWNFYYSLYIVSLFLTFRATSDISKFKNQSTRLERDQLLLEVDNLELRQTNAELELNFLKSQVNPHFLFNTLNSVYSRIFATDEQAANLVLQLSELMRYNLYETNEKYVALDKELNFLQNYLDLERNRLEGQDVSIDYVESGDATQYQIAPLILVAFVENAFKHGVKSVGQPAYVLIMASIEEGQLLFQVENSTPPKRETGSSSSKSGGVGLGNVRRRLDALYKDQYTLDVMETDETYTVLLTIRLQPKAN